MERGTVVNKDLFFKKELYPKEAIMKAAYHFVDRCYIHVDMIAQDYIVRVTPKPGVQLEDFVNEFENELLAQSVRYQVYQQTHTLREILVARAMSSTMTSGNQDIDENNLPEQVDTLENILMDWFERNE